MDPSLRDSIVLPSFNGNFPAWNVTFRDMVGEYAGHDRSEVAPVMEKVLRATREGLFAVGFLSYEASPAFDRAMPGKEPGRFPVIWFRTYETIAPGASLPEGKGRFSMSALQPEMPISRYLEKVKRIKQYLYDGEAYQVNFTYRLLGKFSGCEMSLFRSLLGRENPSYGAYIDCGRYVILSMSPELFFHRAGRSIRTRPMKGTMPRDKDMERDRENLNKLKDSPKERSENLMIVDLLRNDLGKISVPGSVEVPSLFAVEKYRTVYQMTSEIRSTLREGTCLMDVMGSLFPCGSVTGAPKIRSMEIIDELEESPRGIYTGSIGYLAPSGEAVFNVAIRTAVIDRQSGTVEYGTGGGIVHDSTPAEEHRESRTKSLFIRSVAPTFRLIETILYEEGEGLFLLHGHMERMERSARHFGFPFDRQGIEEKIGEEVRRIGRHRMRIRVLLGPEGDVEVKGKGVRPTPPGTVRRVKVYGKPVHRDDELRYHKTTVRDFFEGALREHPEVDDLIFVNGEGELTETSIANIVVEKDGSYCTPPVSSGLLPGTFREKLLREGAIKERVLTPGDLGGADNIFLINSVRKWEKAVIVQ